jgi:hypothetical protein
MMTASENTPDRLGLRWIMASPPIVMERTIGGFVSQTNQIARSFAKLMGDVAAMKHSRPSQRDAPLMRWFEQKRRRSDQ